MSIRVFMWQAIFCMLSVNPLLVCSQEDVVYTETHTVDKEGCVHAELYDLRTFFVALMHGDLECVRKQVTLYPDLMRVRDKHGDTVLHLACRPGNRMLIKFLVERGADVNAKGAQSKTPLLCAAQRGYFDCVTCLVELGADVNAADTPRSLTSLHVAAYEGHLVLIEYLIACGAHCNSQLTFFEHQKWTPTPLHNIVKWGHNHIVRSLVKKGADLRARDAYGNRPLHLAAQRNDLAIAYFLIKSGASIREQNIYGRSPLHVASEYGSFEVARLLLHHGADVDARDEKGMTPLHVAVNNNNRALILLLIEYNADIDALSQIRKSPLSIASVEKNLDAVRLLIRSGADCEILSEDGMPPLYWAAFAEQLTLVRLFLETGAVVNEATRSLLGMKFPDLDWRKIQNEAGKRRFNALEYREADFVPSFATDLNLLIISFLSDAWNEKALREIVRANRSDVPIEVPFEIWDGLKLLMQLPRRMIESMASVVETCRKRPEQRE